MKISTDPQYIDQKSNHAKAYLRVLDEIKQRVLVIQNVFDNKVYLPYIAATELCYLQFRKICELIALGCVIAHEDITKHPKIQREWDAGKIIQRLERLHDNFYPQPITQEKTDSKTGEVSVDYVKEGFLTKKELLKLYYTCAKYMHRGSIEDMSINWYPYPDFADKQIDFSILNDWLKKIITLLNFHQIQLKPENIQLWFGMSDESGNSFYGVMEKIPAPT